MVIQRNRIGLTLFELLVVIVVIAILMAMLLPAVNGSRASAKRMKCTNRMKQMGIALQSYASAHNGRFPKTKKHNGWLIQLDPDEHVSGNSHVIGGTHPSSIEIVGQSALIPSLGDYVEGVGSTFLCPDDGSKRNVRRWPQDVKTNVELCSERLLDAIGIGIQKTSDEYESRWNFEDHRHVRSQQPIF